MKNFLIVIPFLLSLQSCKIDCEGYDLNKELNRWYLFPDNPEILTFNSKNNNQIIFNLIRNQITPDSEHQASFSSRCPTREQSATYEYVTVEGLTSMTSDIHYNGGENCGNCSADISYQINRNRIFFNYHESQIIPVDWTNHQITGTLHSNYTLHTKPYSNLYELDISDSTSIFQKLWFQQNIGVIGIQVNDTTYIKQ